MENWNNTNNIFDLIDIYTTLDPTTTENILYKYTLNIYHDRPYLDHVTSLSIKLKDASHTKCVLRPQRS